MKSSPVTVTNGGVISLEDLPLVDHRRVVDMLMAHTPKKARPVAFFGDLPDDTVARSEGVEIIAALARDDEGSLLLMRTRVPEHFASYTPSCSQLHLFEREIAEQYGVLPRWHPWLKPVRFHGSWRPGKDAWGRAGDTHPVPGDMDFYRVEGEEIHEVAVGPVHAGVIEPGHFRFQCHGEKVLHLEISLGYQHRGVEQLLAGGPHPSTPLQVETLAGDTSVGHSLAYSRLVEAMGGCETSPRANAIRAVGLELERLANHVGDLGAIAGDVAFLPTAAYCGRLRGDYLNMSAEICGSRFGRGLVRPGGVGFDIEPERVTRLLDRLATVERDTLGAVELLFDSPSALARLEGVGTVDGDTAKAVGLVGVAARASGLARDVRHSHSFDPYPAYFDEPAIQETGDVFARAMVRRMEISDSIAFIRGTLQTLPAGDLRVPVPDLRPNALGISLVEGWRGEIVHVARTNEAGRFRRYKVVDPSFHNWTGLAMALRGEQISDFPLCNKSFNLSYCGFDL